MLRTSGRTMGIRNEGSNVPPLPGGATGVSAVQDLRLSPPYPCPTEARPRRQRYALRFLPGLP